MSQTQSVKPAHIRLRVGSKAPNQRFKYNSMTSIDWYSRIFDRSNCHKKIAKYYVFFFHGTCTTQLVKPAHIRLRVRSKARNHRSKHNSMSAIDWYNRIFDSSNCLQKILKILFFSHGTFHIQSIKSAHIRLRVRSKAPNQRSKYNSMSAIEWCNQIFDSSNCAEKNSEIVVFFPWDILDRVSITGPYSSRSAFHGRKIVF